MNSDLLLVNDIKPIHILENYIEMWDYLSSTGKVSCWHEDSYVIVTSKVDDPRFNILVPLNVITLYEYNFIINYYKNRRKNFCIMSPACYLKEIIEQISPYYSHKMYGLVRETCPSRNFDSLDFDKLDFVDMFQTPSITLQWEQVLEESFEMSSMSTHQFSKILTEYNNIDNNFKHYLAYCDNNASTICSVLYSNITPYAGLYNGASIARYRRHKLFIRLIIHHINSAYEKGYKWMLSQSTDIATQALTKNLGFKILDEYCCYTVQF